MVAIYRKLFQRCHSRLFAGAAGNQSTAAMFVIELLEFVDDFVITGVTAVGNAGVVI